jgi:hypothetical protein
MMPSRSLVVVILCAWIAPGCRLVEQTGSNKPLLTAARSSPGSVTLELFFARFPFNSPRANESLWKEVDEQALSAEMRRELAQNGFRAGVVGTTVPEELVELLKLHEKQPKNDGEKSRAVLTAAQLETEPAVTLRVLSAPAGRRCEVLTSHTYESLSVLRREADGIRGKTYHDADGRFDLKAFPQPSGQVRLQLIPELHHGQQKQGWGGQDGVLRLEIKRPVEVFSSLQIESVLAPGQMLLLTSLPERTGSVGHYFFTEPSDGALVQKLLVIRVAHIGQQQESDSPEAVKTLDLGVAVQE